MSLLVLKVLANFGHLPAEVDPCFDVSSEVVHEVAVCVGPRVVDCDHDVEYFFVEFDCVGVVFDFVVELQQVVSEYVLLFVADPSFIGVVSGHQVIFECAQHHDQQLVLLIGNEQQQLLGEVVVLADEFECVFAAMDCEWVETSFQRCQQL